MSITGIFIISIEGRARTRVAGVNVRGIIDQKIKLIDPNVELKQKNFAGLNFVYVWTGIPFHIDQAQPVLGYLKKYMVDYFMKWKLGIEIHLIESEVDENAESEIHG